MALKVFDLFNKSLFRQLLTPFGTVTSNRAVLAGERTIDILFEPAPGVALDADELGVLATMSGQTALFEPFRSALSDHEVHNCFLKLFMLYSELHLQAERTLPTRDLPRLWILAAEVSEILIREFGGVLDPEQGEGFYRLADRFRTTIVVIEELPTTPETLWLRLMGKDRIQEDAIAELLLLPDSNPKRRPALDLLVAWRINMEMLDEVDQEEERILMALSQAYLEWERQTEQRGVERGLERGLERGERSAQQRAIVSILTTRFGALDPQLAAIVPVLVEQPIEQAMPLLLQLSEEELLQRFAQE